MLNIVPYELIFSFRLVIKNMLMSYLLSPRNKQPEVLRAVGGILGFSEEDFDKVYMYLVFHFTSVVKKKKLHIRLNITAHTNTCWGWLLGLLYTKFEVFLLLFRLLVALRAGCQGCWGSVAPHPMPRPHPLPPSETSPLIYNPHQRLKK